MDRGDAFLSFSEPAPAAMRLFLAALLLVLAVPASAQPDPWPAADPADVETIDAVLAAVYDAISGPSDHERDWDRFRSLMHPDARLIPTASREGAGVATVLAVDGYVERAARTFRDAPLFQGKGFYETEAARRVERYGSIAHVWSTYESRLDPAEEPFARGINSFQLFWDGSRWHVLTIYWEQETDATPIPATYLVD